jgi:hypothetical protein
MDLRNATPHLYEAYYQHCAFPYKRVATKYSFDAHEISKNELGMPVEAGEASSTGVLELRKRLKGFETEEGRMLGLGFQCVPACPACAAFILLCMT